jgi:subtilisin family serine protease
VYIVQLRTPPAAEQHVATYGRAAGKPTPGRLVAIPAFDKNNPAVQSQVQRIAEEQANVIARAGQNIETIHSYHYTLNGFAARMTALQANKIEHMPEVLRIWEDEVRPLTTNYSAEFLGLFEPTVGLRGTPGLDGEDIVIGVIDSGIAPEHPALQEFRRASRPRLCENAWAEVSLLGRWLCRRYDQMEDVLLYAPPENWNGECETGDQFAATDCNNKLIGARYISAGAEATGLIDRGEIFSPRDVDGHGTHTATTAAGNRVKASIFGTFFGNVEGIAPRARIAVYKACWLRPDATRASCNTSDLANAIDMAVADGVDIINYSVGSSLFTVIAPDDIALMAAAKAGVLTVVAAGNEGPEFDTITSPAGNPAVITTGASSRDGEHSLEALRVTSPPALDAKYAVMEAAFTPPLIDAGQIEGELVLVDDDSTATAVDFDDTVGTTFDGCQVLTNSAEISGKIAFMQRGGCDFDVKVLNADDAGALAVVVFNLSGPPVVMLSDSVLSGVPAVMIGAADGNLFLDELNNGATINVVLNKSLFLTVADTGNSMGTFSSRGPGPVAGILKPDVTAPGINILAGSTPDAVNSVSGEFFAFLTGTSMATPHVAGVAALLKQAHPEWSPAALKSALMTTAYQSVTQADGETPAHPFDFGSGHIEPNKANDPGLVYDITADEYDAFACGVESPDVTEEHCDDLAQSGFSFDPSNLNQPSISIADMTGVRTVTRRVTNVGDASETYSLEIEAPVGIGVQVMPASLMIGPGQTATYDVTFNYESGPLDFYRFGSLTWVNNDHAVRSVLSIRPLAIKAPGDILAFGGTGEVAFPVEFGYSGPYAPEVHGLHAPERADTARVAQDPTKNFTLRGTNGVTAHEINVAANQLYIRFALFDAWTDGNDDLDLYVYHCVKDQNMQETCFKLGESGGPTSEEMVDAILPAGGKYLAFVHGFETDPDIGGAGAVYTLYFWELGIVDDQGNMTATGPPFVLAGTTEDVTVNWAGLSPDTIYLGGISHNTPDGPVALTVIRVEN